MNRTYFLSVLASGMALLLFPAQAARNAPEKDVVRSTQQEESPSIHVDIDRDELDVDMDVQVDVPDVEVELDEPQIEMDVDSDEPEMDADFDQEDVDSEEIDHDEASFTEHEQETIQKSFAMPAGAGRARKEVTLDITLQADALKLYVNGPFCCDCHDCGRSRDDEGYVVKMDFQVQVPRDIDIKVKTVNEGRVSVRDINGSFLVRNVNGDIQMHNIAGSGTARTVNGPVKVSFRQNPREASGFETVNGNVELQFARDLSADFRFKTFNGGIYSDFPVRALPVQGMQEEHHGTKVIFRADRYTGARVNSGGTQIKVENLNGDIRILENHE
jgi:hypothetical protein